MSRVFRMSLAAIALVALVLPAASEDLEELLTQVGEQYAKGYISPLIHAWGANQNSALYHTARIPGTKLTVSVGLKVMGTSLNEDDQSFQSVMQNVELADFLPDDNPYANQTGDIVMTGPTVFGDTESSGSMTAYVGGLPVYRIETIPGLVDTRWVPLAAPQLEVGGLLGLRGTLRYVPEVEAGDYGDTKYMGYGASWSPNHFIPTLPVDLMIGFFKQEIDVGTIVETEASSVYLAASRKFKAATLYGGVASESSSMDVAYTFEDEQSGFDPTEIAFSVDGEMDSRFTIGASTNGAAKLYAEMNVGTLTVYSAGFIFGY